MPWIGLASEQMDPEQDPLMPQLHEWSLDILLLLIWTAMTACCCAFPHVCCCPCPTCQAVLEEPLLVFTNLASELLLLLL